MVALPNGKLPFWKVFTTFLLSQSALHARGVSAQNDETEGTTAEITINRAIEIGKLHPLFAHFLFSSEWEQKKLSERVKIAQKI